MNEYLKPIKELIENSKPSYGNERLHSLLDMIWDTYASANPIRSKEITQTDHKLDSIMEMLSPPYSDQLFLLIAELCESYEHAAFLDGLKVGAGLVLELMDEQNHRSL